MMCDCMVLRSDIMQVVAPVWVSSNNYRLKRLCAVLLEELLFEGKFQLNTLGCC